MNSRAWCPACRLVDHVDEHWRCLWCGTVTLERISESQARESRVLSLPQLRAIHSRYACGEPLKSLARAHHMGRDTLKHNFWAAGLPTRTLQVTNMLEAPRRRLHRAYRNENPSYRRELADQAVAASYLRTGSLRLTAAALGCSQSTVHRRLTGIGHTRHAVGRNQHSKAVA